MVAVRSPVKKAPNPAAHTRSQGPAPPPADIEKKRTKPGGSKQNLSKNHNDDEVNKSNRSSKSTKTSGETSVKAVRGGQPAGRNRTEEGADLQNKTIISETTGVPEHLEDKTPEHHEQQGTPKTVVRAQTSTTNLAQKAAAAGLNNAHRVLLLDRNRHRFHNTVQEDGTDRARAMGAARANQSLDFDPLLRDEQYSSRQKELFRTSRLPISINVEASTREESRSIRESVAETMEPTIDLATMEREAMNTQYDSIKEIRVSINNLETFVRAQEGISGAAQKQELIEVQQNLVKRITDHCLLRGHLFLAEGKFNQGELLIALDKELKNKLLNVLSQISSLKDPDEHPRQEESSRYGSYSPNIAGVEPTVASIAKRKTSKNGFKTNKTSKRAAASQERKIFEKELTRRSMAKANLESTRFMEGVEKSNNASQLEQYLEKESRSRLEVPKVLDNPTKHRTYKTREHRLPSAPEPTLRTNSLKKPPVFANTEPQQIEPELAGLHGEAAESESFYEFLPAPWNRIPDLQGQSFNQLLALQKNGLLPTFDGNQGNYQNFRSMFTMMVHSARIGVFAKDILLRQALKTCTSMSTLLAAAPPGQQGYAMIVSRLEEKFGGSTKLLNHYLTKLRRLQPVQEGQVENLEELLDTANGYHAALEAWGAQDATTHSHYTFILNKLAPMLRLKYHTFILQAPGETQHDVKHLLIWANNHLLKPWRLEPNAYKKQVDRKVDKVAQGQFRQQPD